MRFRVIRNKIKYRKFPKKDADIARTFCKKIYKELGNFVVAAVFFGSSARNYNAKTGDVDILLIVDDVHMRFNKEVIQTYRIILAKTVASVAPNRLHIQSMTWSSFWEYIRAGDPVAINILRDGVPLIDTGFFEPMQLLLRSGKIRPSSEAIWTYFSMAPNSLVSANSKLDSAIVDLYWACIDAAHAALMSLGEIPPSPSHVANMIEKKMVNEGYVSKRYADIMRHMYDVAKRIMHGQIHGLDGRHYDRYRKTSNEFVSTMRKFIESKNKI